jgi:hypothetical protein
MNVTTTTVRADQLVPGQFIERVLPAERRGPRGGRYRTQHGRVEATVTKVEPGLSQRRHIGTVVYYGIPEAAVWLFNDQPVEVRA